MEYVYFTVLVPIIIWVIYYGRSLKDCNYTEKVIDVKRYEINDMFLPWSYKVLYTIERTYKNGTIKIYHKEVKY